MKKNLAKVNRPWSVPQDSVAIFSSGQQFHSNKTTTVFISTWIYHTDEAIETRFLHW
jgi:hypothetical protein